MALDQADAEELLEQRVRELERENQRLRQGEERLRAIFDAEPHCVLVLDALGDVLDANSAGLELWQAESKEEVVGRCILPLIAEAQHDTFRELLDDALRGNPCMCELEVTALKGRRCWVELQASRLGEQRGVAAVVVVMRDVTARKQAETKLRVELAQRGRTEAALRESEYRLLLALSAARMGTWERNLVTGRIVCSEEFRQLYGGQPAPTSERELYRYVHADDRERVRATVARAVAMNIPYECEFRIVWRNNEIRWHAAFGRTVRDASGQASRLVGVVMDITERKRLNEAVQEQQRRGQKILDSMFAFVGLFSVDGVVLEVNRAPLEAAGLKAEDVIGKPFVDSYFWAHSADEREHVRSTLERAARGETVRDYFSTQMAGGRLVICDAVFGPLRDASGRITELVASAVDVTERKLAEEARFKLEAQLRQSQKLEAVGTLAGGIAHDFNNLLSAMIGNAELVALELDPDHSARESVHEILRAGQRARALVRRLLAFSRPQDSELKTLDLKAALLDAVHMLRPTIPAGVELQYDVHERVPPVKADPTQVQQVIVNLVANAWQAMEGGTGRIDVRIECCSVHDGSDASWPELRPGEYVRVSVSDSGSGIEPATLPRIFEPFFTTKPPGQGSGLGLSMAHTIMRTHGGTITVESTPGRGSAFHLYFPALEPRTSPTPELPAEPCLTSGRGEHILFIDDEAPLVRLAKRFFTRLGYRISAYTRAEQALAQFRERPWDFDLVITDFNMPGMSGMDVAKEVFAVRPDAPVLLTSGYLRPTELEAARALGIRDVILKPSTVQELGPIVQTTLAAKSA